MTALCLMFPLLAAVEGLTCPQPLPPYRATEGIQTGYLSQYGPQVSVWMVEYGQQQGYLPLDLSGIDGFIAVDDCGLLGRRAWLSVEGDSWLSVVVFDCTAHPDTLRWMHRHNILAEVSYNLAERYGFIGRGGIRARLCWVAPDGGLHP